MKKSSGFSLIEIIVVMAILAILAGAIVPVLFNRLEQARYERTQQDLQAIYEAAMGVPAEDYFGFVGDVGRLPDSVAQLMDSTGQGSAWNGPYLAFGGGFSTEDIYGMPYVIDSNPIIARSFGPDRTDNNGAGDDIVYPENPLTTYKGQLEVQVYINGRLIADATQDQVSATLAYSNNGTPDNMTLTFSTANMQFTLPSAVHQGKHVLTVNAAKATQDPATETREVVTILPGAVTRVQISMEDADYMTRLDTDLNGNGLPDRLEDTDGDGIPDDMDNDIDGDGTPNAIDPDPYDPTVGGGGGDAAPIVNNVIPSYGYRGDNNLTVTIDGAYFQNGATVAFSGTGITVLTVPATFNGSSQLVVDINISGSAPTGFRDVTVTNPNELGGTGENMFEVLAGGGTPSPTIAQVTPNSVYQGEAGSVISIQGQNFVSGCTVTFSNSGITIVSGPNYINSTEVQVTIDVTENAPPGAGTVRLTNPDAKYDEATFTIDAVVPVVSLLNPNSARRNRNNIVVTITGSNFLSAAQVTTGGQWAAMFSIDSYIWDSSTQMRVQGDTGWWLFGGDRQLYIIVSNPGGAADSATFTVTRN